MSIRISPTALGVVVICAAILIGPFATADGYDWTRHSISELGAQNTPGAWIMNLGFVAFGVGVLADAGRRLRGAPIVGAAFMAFGGSLLSVAAFSHRPIDPAIAFDARGEALHSVFASAMGVAYCVGTFAQSAIEKAPIRRALCWAAGLAAALLSAAMSAFPDFLGVLQRAMFASSFVWLCAFLPPRPSHGAPP